MWLKRLPAFAISIQRCRIHWFYIKVIAAKSNILRNKSALLMEICITFTCFQTLRPRKRGFLHETGFSSTSIDTTLMVPVLPNRKSLDFDYLKSRQMERYTNIQNSQMNLASGTGNPNKSAAKPGGFAAITRYTRILFHKAHL